MSTFGQGLWGESAWGGGTSTSQPTDNVITDVQRLIADGGVFWSSARVASAVNNVQLQLATVTRDRLITVDMAIGASEPFITLPANVFIPQTLRYNNEVYFPTTHARLEQYNRDWQASPRSRPSWFVLWDAEHFRPYPIADKEYTFQLTGVAWPNEVSVESPSLAIDKALRLAIVNLAAASLLRYTRPDLADAYEAEATEALQRYKSMKGRRSSHNIRRVRPGTAFTAAQSGNVDLGMRY